MQTRFSIGANGSAMQKYNSGVGTVVAVTVSSDVFAVQERSVVDFKGDSAEFAAKDALFDIKWVFAIDQKVRVKNTTKLTKSVADKIAGKSLVVAHIFKSRYVEDIGVDVSGTGEVLRFPSTDLEGCV